MVKTKESFGKIFKECKFWLDDFLENKEKISLLICENGGLVINQNDNCFHLTPSRFDLNSVTHVITSSCYYPELKDANVNNIISVKPEWIESSLKVGHLQEPKYFSINRNDFFSGVIVHCSDQLSPCDIKNVYAAVTAFGGQYRTSYSVDVTHYIFMFINKKTLNELAEDVMYVHPSWIEDSLRVSFRCPETDYFLVEPISKPAKFCNIAISKENSVFEGLRFYLSAKYTSSDPLFTTLTTAGAIIEKSINEPRISFYLFHGNSADQVRTAFSNKKFIVTSTWVTECIKHRKLISPYEKLSYQPVLPMNTDKLRGAIITISSYSGEERELIQKMIKAVGATFTGKMSRNNTHLICSSPNGEKYEKALEWNIQIVNHFWIESIFTHCQFQSEAKPQFLSFPKSLAHMVGRRHGPSLDFMKAPINNDSQKSFPSTQNNSKTRKPAFKIQSNGSDSESSSKTASKRKRAEVSTPEPDMSSGSDPLLSQKDKPVINPVSKETDNDKPKTRQKNKKQKKLKFILTGVEAPIYFKVKTLNLGIEMVNDVFNADVIVSAKFMRTEKTLIGINLGLPLVHVSWLVDCEEKRTELDYKNYLIQDDILEARYHFRLKESLNKAVSSKKFLSDYCFTNTTGVNTPPDSMRKIVTSAGAEYVSSAKTVEKLQSLDINEMLKQIKRKYLIIIGDPSDAFEVKVWKQKGYSVHSVELLLTGILRQILPPLSDISYLI